MIQTLTMSHKLPTNVIGSSSRSSWAVASNTLPPITYTHLSSMNGSSITATSHCQTQSSVHSTNTFLPTSPNTQITCQPVAQPRDVRKITFVTCASTTSNTLMQSQATKNDRITHVQTTSTCGSTYPMPSTIETCVKPVNNFSNHIVSDLHTYKYEPSDYSMFHCTDFVQSNNISGFQVNYNKNMASPFNRHETSMSGSSNKSSTLRLFTPYDYSTDLGDHSPVSGCYSNDGQSVGYQSDAGSLSPSSASYYPHGCHLSSVDKSMHSTKNCMNMAMGIKNSNNRKRNSNASLSTSEDGSPDTFVARRNERERTRVKYVNEGFDVLRSHLPITQAKRLSKVQTLKMAIEYIRELELQLESDDDEM